MKLYIICWMHLVLFSTCSFGSQSFNDSLLIGTWRGTSICQVKPSPCNDEIAAYHITKGEKPNVFHMVMNKMINGKEEAMGEGDYIFNPADSSLYCYLEKYKVAVKLIVKGNKMDGTLTANNTLYRIIKLTKSGE